MPPFDEDTAAQLQGRVLLVLLVAVSVAFGWILLPFNGTILWAAIIALLLAPLYRRLLVRLKRRRTPAALLTLLVVLVIVVIPLVLVTAALAREAAQVYERVQSGDASFGAPFYHRVRPLVERTIRRLMGSRDPDYDDLVQSILDEAQ